MTWEILIPLIAKYGLPWVLDLIQIIMKHPVPTQEAWGELLKLSQRPYDDYIAEAKGQTNQQ
jgi:hypothetical protein